MGFPLLLPMLFKSSNLVIMFIPKTKINGKHLNKGNLLLSQTTPDHRLKIRIYIISIKNYIFLMIWCLFCEVINCIIFSFWIVFHRSYFISYFMLLHYLLDVHTRKVTKIAKEHKTCVFWHFPSILKILFSDILRPWFLASSQSFLSWSKVVNIMNIMITNWCWRQETQRG